MLLSVLLLAAFLRLHQLDLIDYRYDEALAPLLALRITQGEWLSIAPFSGSVANHPPVYLYVLAAPYLLTRDLMIVAAYRAMLDVVAIALLWAVCRRHLNLRVALIAALLFAVAPWAIQFARKLWLAPLPLFSVVLMWGLLEVAKRRNPWGWSLIGFGLALCVGSHLAALYLVPVVGLAVLLCFRSMRIKPVLVGMLPLMGLVALYAVHDAPSGFENVKALLSTGGATSVIYLSAFHYALWISGGAHISDLTAQAFPIWQQQVPPLFESIDVLQQVLLMVSVVVLAVVALRALFHRELSKAAVYILILAFWLLPIGLQLSHSRPIQLHYLTPLYPAPFVIGALGVDHILGIHTRWRNFVRGIVLGMLACIVVWQLLTTLRFTDFVSQHDTSSGGYGLPARGALTVKQQVREIVCPDGVCSAEVIVMTPGGDPLVNELATVFATVLADTPHRFADSNAGLVLLNSPTVYIVTPGAESALDELRELAMSPGVSTIAIPVRMGSPLQYQVVSTSALDLIRYRTGVNAAWANGVSLSGYRIDNNGALALSIVLHVDALPPANADYHWYNHLYSGGIKVAQYDGGGIHPSSWRKGDLLLHWFTIDPSEPVVPKDSSIRIGSYLYPSLEVVPVILSDGTTSDGVALPID